MRLTPDRLLRLLLAALTCLPGCALQRRHRGYDYELEYYKTAATRIEYPDVESPGYYELSEMRPPVTINNYEATSRSIELSTAIEYALLNSQVFRDAGGALLQRPQPESVQTVYDPSRTETDPRFGVDAALSAFDASFQSEFFFENNDRALNNVFFGGGTRIQQQDLHRYQTELSKRTATGAELALRKIIGYDANNAPGNDDPNRPWTVQVEGEFRQPLLQGAGVEFNRIAGPDARPGVFNGVLIARLNTDVALADFEGAVTRLVSDVEEAYWGLALAYRELAAAIQVRDQALEHWNLVKVLAENGQDGGETERDERRKYFEAEAAVQTAWAGGRQDRTQTDTFQPVSGVLTAERRLRRLMGIELNDGQILRPTSQPGMAQVVFAWGQVVEEALTRRAELRKQKWNVKQRELELVAAKNFLRPRVDMLGRYRFRGLGHRFSNADRQDLRFDSALQDLTSGDFQEWQLGLEVTFPVGYRQAYAGVRNAELWLYREKALLEEQEKEVVWELSESYAELARAYETAHTLHSAKISAEEHLSTLDARIKDADIRDNLQLFNQRGDAARRISAADVAFYRALIDHTIAIKDVHRSKGSLLEYNEVYLSEGPWPGKAYEDAEKRDRTRFRTPKFFDYIMRPTWPIALGEYEQRVVPYEELPDGPGMEHVPPGAPAPTELLPASESFSDHPPPTMLHDGPVMHDGIRVINPPLPPEAYQAPAYVEEANITPLPEGPVMRPMPNQPSRIIPTAPLPPASSQFPGQSPGIIREASGAPLPRPFAADNQYRGAGQVHEIQSMPLYGQPSPGTVIHEACGVPLLPAMPPNAVDLTPR